MRSLITRSLITNFQVEPIIGLRDMGESK